MDFYPQDIFEKLEFDKVKEILEKYCLGELGKEQIRKLSPHKEHLIIENLLAEVSEYKVSIDQSHRFPITNYESVAKDLRMLDIADYVLPVDGLRRINVILLSIRNIYKFFKNRKTTYPILYKIIQDTPFDEDLLKAIERVIDEEGNIRPDASPELMRIRKMILSKYKEMDKKFRQVIGEYVSKGWLSETVESFKNGRRVLSVPAQHKRKVRGIIHDESATGQTAYIEPEPIIEINNDIFGFEQEEKREIYKILKQLSDVLRPYTRTLRRYETFLTRFDVIQAKANLAVKMKAEKPKIVNKPNVNFKHAYHPLLLLKNNADNKKTIPFTLEFQGNNRILMLSGPNAGGKSIAMKSIGLLQLMVQAGLLIPAHEDSEVGIFKKFFTDIGDQQSLEDDLSTYSSRLRNARYFVEHADKETLVLIDEFGSGTDPKIGGAIAEAILRDLNYKKVFGVVTTHYSNLKIFAFKNKGIINGSMMFNRETLSPTYEMKPGRPGSSYAYEIAQKSGLSDKVLKYAKHKTGENQNAVDQLLVDLQSEKKELEDRLKSTEEQQKKLDKLIKSYERMAKELEYNRKKLKLDIKQQEAQQTAKTNKELEKLIRNIREEKNLEKAKELAAKVREEKKVLSKTVTDLTEDIYYKPTEKKAVKKGEIKVGDYVKLRTGGSAGKLESIDKNRAVVVMGALRMTVKLRDLQQASEPLDVNLHKRVTVSKVEQAAKFETKIDIRGMRRDEALHLVESFVDEALISNANTLRIIHGKGDGVLRKAVKMKLREFKDVMNIYHEAAERGGDGVTIVDLG